MNLYQSSTYQGDIETALDSVIDIEKLKGSAVLITGASGLIGSFIVDMLLCFNKKENAGIKIYAAGRNIKRLAERFEAVKTQQLNFIEHDVNNKPDFDFKVDYIIHAASPAYPAAFVTDPVGTILSNVLGAQYLLEYAKNTGVKRFLFVSSGEVYGQCQEGIKAFEESYSGYVDPVQPRSCYPSSKRAAETLCVSYTQQYELDTVIVRPCHTYGPNVTSSDNRASVQFINNAVRGEDIVMKSAGLQLRSYCYVADCASAILSVLLCGETAQAYNVANPDARVTIAKFAKTAAEIAGTKVVFSQPDEEQKSQQTPISYAVLDTQKLCSLGWRGNYSVEKGIQNTIYTLSGK